MLYTPSPKIIPKKITGEQTDAGVYKSSPEDNKLQVRMSILKYTIYQHLI